MATSEPRALRNWGGRRSLTRSSLPYLRAADLFRDLTDQELDTVHGFFPMEERPRGTVLFQHGEPADGLFILKTGRVVLYRLTPDGHRMVVGTVGPGMVFGEMALAGQSMRDCFAEAQEDALVCVVTRKDLEALVTRRPQVAFRLLAAAGQRILALEEQLERVAYRPVSERLAELLLEWAHSEAECLVVRGYSQEDLANAIGAARQTVSQELNRLEAAGYIAVRRRAITLLARQELQRIAAGDW